MLHEAPRHRSTPPRTRAFANGGYIIMMKPMAIVVDEFASPRPMRRRSRLFINFLFSKSTNTEPVIYMTPVP
jgi:hypothetical protein